MALGKVKRLLSVQNINKIRGESKLGCEKKACVFYNQINTQLAICCHLIKFDYFAPTVTELLTVRLAQRDSRKALIVLLRNTVYH